MSTQTSALPRGLEQFIEPASGLRITSFPTDLGWMVTLTSHDQLVALKFGYRSVVEALAAISHESLMDDGPTPEWVFHLVARLRGYAGGRPEDLSDVPVDLSQRTHFQQRVLGQCRQIPWGQTLTYGALAARAGSPHAARAVGNIMAGNPIPLVIPCHRVVGSGGALGGFSAPGGLRTKRRLLALEETSTPVG